MEETTRNILRGVGVGAANTAYSILLPYFTIKYLFSGALLTMMYLGGNVDDALFWIVSLGIVTVSLKVARGYSPKRSGSVRREALGLGLKVIRWFVLVAVIVAGSTVLYFSVEMGEGVAPVMSFDFTPYFVVALGFVLFRMIPNAYGLVEAVVVTKKGALR
ncbi:MAG: hypothetical protein ACTSU5_02575 [Promethearchaeota archaeon]